MTTNLPRTPQEIQNQVTQFNLEPFEEDFDKARQLKQEFEQAKARWELYKNRLKLRADRADELVLRGVVVATNAISGPFNVAKLRDTQPHLYEQYLVKQEVEVFDEDRFAAENPGLHTGDAFRSRSLRFKI